MIYLVMGTKNSGKSLLAEDLAINTGDPHRIYLATMKIYDDEGKERVQRHRRQREGKGFDTIEREYNITDVISSIDEPGKTTVLLECVSNLVGNEMYENAKERGFCDLKADILKDMISDDSSEKQSCNLLNDFSEIIAEDIKRLGDSVNNLIIVTNEYEKDAEGYDDETRLYVKVLCMVNKNLMDFSDKIYDLRKEGKT
ncbi:bifunctional adenosylcobinamide kinase/adenosylcobinamide-phosphate guanylyltransferase [Butyrivibrio sp. AE3004]|uniref:bifunctional adenosylcobinamide kinase/adenosylcobinamide-phosphate guanylyltransferase n=1 Tax=Butyrivibrio sp. AE3004 TaxID=1506994 RepID=UPI00068B8DCD|nr:bifunctional adenosylcobinamide kinase/adenosylcobinamide-phosphate guanylyltransferase [Butyrivibrio sp. AE3004]